MVEGESVAMTRAEEIAEQGLLQPQELVQAPTPQVSRARASKELGELFEAALKEPHAHQKGVCAKLEIDEWRHWEWMRSRTDDTRDYRMAVIRGLDYARIADINATDRAIEEADAAHCSTVWNSRKHRHESRFRSFYDEPTKIEHSGPNGGPIEHATVLILPSNGREPNALPDDGDGSADGKR